jgi:Fe-S oxidoreductase
MTKSQSPNTESPGLAGFRQRYGPDHIVEYTPEESQLLHQFEGCINCGLCLAECVVLRNLITDSTQYAGPRSIGTSLSRSTPEFWATSDTIYLCTMCGACEAVCPAQVPIPEIVAMIRAKIPRQAENLVPKAHAALASNLEQSGNIYGQQIAPFQTARKDPEYVFFVGCVGSYLERESVEHTLQLLNRLDVSFTTIAEMCCGGPTQVAGAPMPDSLVQHNLDAILATGTNKVITSCPRCYATLSSHPAYAGKLDVQHTTHFLTTLDWQPLTDRVVTYHDPCELGRYGGEYDAVRSVLRQVAPRYVEMPNARESSICCGAGGGLRGVQVRLSIQIARSRLEEAIGVGAEVLVTECYSCLHNFYNATRSRDDIETYTLSEFLSLLMNDDAGK